MEPTSAQKFLLTGASKTRVTRKPLTHTEVQDNYRFRLLHDLAPVVRPDIVLSEAQQMYLLEQIGCFVKKHAADAELRGLTIEIYPLVTLINSYANQS